MCTALKKHLKSLCCFDAKTTYTFESVTTDLLNCTRMGNTTQAFPSKGFVEINVEKKTRTKKVNKTNNTNQRGLDVDRH